MKKITKIVAILMIFVLLSACRKSGELNISSQNSIPEIVSSEPVISEEEIVSQVESEETVAIVSSSVSESSVVTPVVEEPPPPPVEEPNRVNSTANITGIKAIWLSQFDLNYVFTNNKSQRSSDSFTVLIKTIMYNINELGFNTIFLQIRPYADSMYPSNIYPTSRFVVGKYGKELNYDPVKIIVEEAHKVGLDVHAWINPLRAMTLTEITQISDKYKIKQWYNDSTLNGKYLVPVENRLYLNPAYSEVRSLIIDGAVEALNSYEFDGLHMDDYFYPTMDPVFDEVAYNEYLTSGGTGDLSQFRRQSLNSLISGLYSAVKSVNSNLLFGISPQGNYEKAYNQEYADLYTWCSNGGYIDYICPQIYFGFTHQTHDFVKICEQYQNMIKVDSVKLIVGITLGKAKLGYDQYAGTGVYEWSQSKDILMRQVAHTKNLSKCAGVSVFCYQHIYNPVTNVQVSETAHEVTNLKGILKEINWLTN